MKNLILILAILIGFTTSAQYKQWSLEASFGGNNVSDESAVIKNNEYLSHYEGVIRYNLSPTFGLGAYLGYSDLELRDFNRLSRNNNFYRGNIEAVVDIFDVVDMQNDTFTLLVHSGPGLTYFNNEVDEEYLFNISSGLTGLFKLSNNLALKLDYTMTAQFDQYRTLDGSFVVSNRQSSSFVNNLSVGLAFYLNNKEEDEQHADWYIKQREVDTIYIVKETIVNRNIEPKTIVYNKCDCSIDENVFFKHDSYAIDKDGLNAIAKAIEYAKNGKRITVVGYASDTKSSSEYNMELSKRRADNVSQKLINGGISENNITIRYMGKDYTKSEEVHDLARTVKILVE